MKFWISEEEKRLIYENWYYFKWRKRRDEAITNPAVWRILPQNGDRRIYPCSRPFGNKSIYLGIASNQPQYKPDLQTRQRIGNSYRQAKQQMSEYGIIKKNVDSILYPSQSKTRNKNGKQNQGVASGKLGAEKFPYNRAFSAGKRHSRYFIFKPQKTAF
ncbi:hypothetical protein [Intestinibacillus massiliensis]|uniref:hypothetical protein n=1 Tax=Intestinibacillus massiliensis TaxID=1871029 RepID=UPI001F316F24|nr:hypothetical protein [Intestinibacillus massiliensis]